MHGNNKTEAELRYAVEQGVGTIVVDSFDEIERLERIAPEGQKVMLRVTPGIKPDDALATSRPARSTRSSASRSTTCRARSTR